MKNKGFIRAVLFVLISQSIFGVSTAKANTLPTFSTCPNPGGVIVSQFNNGTHGIAGSANVYTGSDTVYKINNDQITQCFCPENATSGIQTNWVKITNPSDAEINTYKNMGWIYIPDGSLWGLDASGYVAKNSTFSCAGASNTNNGNGSSTSSSNTGTSCPSAKPNAPTLNSVRRSGTTATLTWTAVEFATHYTISYGVEQNKFIYGVPNTGNVTQFTVGSLDPNKTYFWEVRAVNNCAPSDASSMPRGGGDVLGESKGFASTGNVESIILTMGLGLILLGLSLAVKNRREVQK